MSPGETPTRRRFRRAARLLLLAGLALCLFSIFFYTSVFWSAGKGIALHSGRASLILGSSSGMEQGFTCYRTEPVLLYGPLMVFRGTVFVALPLWVVGVPGAALLGMDAWMLLRMRRGRCYACGYSLAGLRAGACCPECGLSPDPKLATRGQRLRIIGRDMLERALRVGTFAGVLVVLAWMVSGLYGLTFHPNSHTTMELTRGRFEMRTWPRRARTPTAAAPARTSYEPMSVPAWKYKVLIETIDERRDLTRDIDEVVPRPSARPLPSSLACAPLHPIGWRFAWEFGGDSDSGERTAAVPLWWIAPVLLACAIPAVRRRLSRGSRVRLGEPSHPAAAANVPSEGGTPS